MARVSLTQGAYQARSVIAAAQSCVNLYPEKNPQGEDSPFTHYSTPGLTQIAGPTGYAGRGLYLANSGQLFYASGPTLYTVSTSWALTAIGTIDAGTTPVSMADNGTSLVLVDGTGNGYEVDLTTLAFSQISEANNGPPPDPYIPADSPVYAFYGADRVDILDGFLIFNEPGTRNFYCTYNNEVVFDATYFAAKNGYSDNLVAPIVTDREIWLIGAKTTEIWFDAGSSNFPFQLMPGPFIQHGCTAVYSIAQVNSNIFWLSDDQAGQNVVLRGHGYEAVRISTHAMEVAMASYPTTTDAVGFCYQQEGHPFYFLNFPSGNATWVWDESTELWHQRSWTDANGTANRHRAQCQVFAYGTNVVADWQTGQLYAFDLGNHTDNGAPIIWRRGWPHLMDDGKRVRYARFVLDAEPATSLGTSDGTGPFPLLAPGQSSGIVPNYIFGQTSPSTQPILIPGAPGNPPLVSLRWSDTRGLTWSNPVTQTMGSTGQTLTQIQWRRLGMARDRVFEVFGPMQGRIAINGAFIDAETARS